MSFDLNNPPLGFITKQQRTPEQHDAHARAEAGMVKHYALPVPDVPKGTRVMLSDAWKHPDVVKDLGFAFPRFHQLTGSCVGAGGGNALATLICLQRLLSDGATRAVLPFWPFDYGRCRYNEGDRGQGEGAMGSSFADTIVKEGVLDANEPGLPAFTNSDGLTLTSQLEMQYSDGAASVNTQWLDTAKRFPLGSTTPCRSSQDIKALVLNGYPGSFACDNYIGNAAVQGSGTDARVVGRWNGRGGHQQYFLGYEENATLGPLYLIGNNWPGNTYPSDPGGAPLCTCWVKESDVDAAFRLDAEVYGFSHLTWFPAQIDKLINLMGM